MSVSRERRFCMLLTSSLVLEALATTSRLEYRQAVASAVRVATALSVTDVRFRDIDPDEIRRYWLSGEPQGKAGAYAIQGRGGVFVEAIMGSYTGVVGLPVFETARLLQAAGLDVLPAELTESQSGAPTTNRPEKKYWSM